jgi:transcriptional antiterminator RfaH
MQSTLNNPAVSFGREEWFTLHTHPKHEHIAAANLATMLGIEVWNPRIVFTRATRRGPATVSESVFPGYIFARFDLNLQLDLVRYTPGVATVVHFGGRYPTMPFGAIQELKQHFDGGDFMVLDHDMVEGEKIVINTGSLCGVEAIVLRSLPARKRVQVLLELLGTTTAVELDLNAVSVQRKHPRSLAA